MVAVALPLLTVTGDETAQIDALLGQLERFKSSNVLKTRYYEGSQRVQQLGIAVPPSLQSLDTVVGWPGIAVDVLEERLDWLGWVAPDGDFGLGEVYRANRLASESSLGHLDALIYGVSFVVVGSGGQGEPDPLVTAESPMSMTASWDRRSRRISAALTVTANELGTATEVTLYLPDETIRYERARGMWRVVERDEHRLGRVPVARLVNRPWGSRREGRSEITRAVRSLTDQAIRTLLGAEVSREFYAAPQRWVMGAEESAFVDTDGNPVPAWESYLGRFLALSRDEEGELPQVGQFPASSPSPYFEQLHSYAQLFAAEAGLPSAYLGFSTDNPASADAIKAGEVRLLKRAERRSGQFDLGWTEVAELSFMVREGTDVLPDGFNRISSAWRDPSTPTRAAATDAAVKLVVAGVLPADSSVTYDLIGLSPSEQQRLEADKRRTRASGQLALLQQAASRVRTPLVDDLVSRPVQ